MGTTIRSFEQNKTNQIDVSYIYIEIEKNGNKAKNWINNETKNVYNLPVPYVLLVQTIRIDRANYFISGCICLIPDK